MNLMRGINLQKIAADMSGASGAEVKAVCTEAGMFALRERRVHVSQEDFQMAVAKVSFLIINKYDVLIWDMSGCFSGDEKGFGSGYEFA